MFESMLSKDVVFSSCRQTLRDLRRLPMCPYTDWVFNNVHCHCDMRLDDFINFMNYREFNPVRALYNFEQVYRNVPFAGFLLFPNITEEDLAQNQRREREQCCNGVM